MKTLKKLACTAASLAIAFTISGCSSLDSITGGKRIIRISHAQSESHPEHQGLLKFKEVIESQLGDKYEVQIFPNELLGAAQKAIELCQTGAIDFVVAGTANVETFEDSYEIFSMPYLFTSPEAYHEVMNDAEYMEKLYESTDQSGFRVMTWFDAGVRSFYSTKKIETPDDLKGQKIRVQQSPASVAMVKAFGAAASPMAFGEVYTAIQQGVIQGAENNELALTNNKHGEVAKYYSYTNHQMVPDVLIGNTKFLDSLSPEEYDIFMDAAQQATQLELDEWEEAAAEATDYAKNTQKVEFIEVDIEKFRDKVIGVQQEMIDNNPKITEMYEHIQKVNEEYENKEDAE
ncbi:TRAP transporter substrate-binding protein [Ileibacterium valens]|uniref:TRAP transporter substrate-binding protein n=1 Tax=Ileibacterium valens TaxID=1862668 RepID=UPI0024BAD870|nr:TRAP transporter substrate-binding protein [Ileibacterium valens]